MSAKFTLYRLPHLSGQPGGEAVLGTCSNILCHGNAAFQKRRQRTATRSSP
uniref:CxxxxCH/CxxCH domain-containing protein n=1 Tax=Pedobacter duraquae TaxID=425511 RepID=UPI003744786E